MLPGLFSKGKKRELREQREASSNKLQAASLTGPVGYYMMDLERKNEEKN
tara:strand:+ start:361 stop:510 length:150 start_codon:yes stop_codon:yes gene_type:complete